MFVRTCGKSWHHTNVAVIIPHALHILTLTSAEKSYLMANTFSQIYIQTVFAVSGRLSLVTSDFKEELHKYITGIVTKQGQKLIRINGIPDHLHILIGLKPVSYTHLTLPTSD